MKNTEQTMEEENEIWDVNKQIHPMTACKRPLTSKGANQSHGIDLGAALTVRNPSHMILLLQEGNTSLHP